MEQADLFLRFGVAAALGFLIGLQREYALGLSGIEIAAGERTLALMSLTGCLAAMAADALDSALGFVVIIFIVGMYTVVGYYVEASTKGFIGLTSEVAAVVTIIIGALCYWGHLNLAVALGITTLVLLSLKLETDQFVRQLTREDVVAALKFLVISAVVLPVLPDQPIWDVPPLNVINPFKIWLMVVFISGISFIGYVLIKVVGSEQAIGLTGLLGGLVSSTAVTLTFSERSHLDKELSKPFALAIVIAWTVMFPRVLIEIGVLNIPLLKIVLWPIGAAMLAGLSYCAYLFFSQRSDEKGEVEFSNPFDLASAIKFGLLYGVILLVSAAANQFYGETGTFISSIVSGLADVDAITLSNAELSIPGGVGGVSLETASQAILLAAMSNTVVKGGIVLMSGGKELRKAILPGLLIILLVLGIGVAFVI